MKHHETNQTSRQREQQFFWQVHGQTSLTASHDITSFVGQRRDVMRWTPAGETVVKIAVGEVAVVKPWPVDTHRSPSLKKAVAGFVVVSFLDIEPH